MYKCQTLVNGVSDAEAQKFKKKYIAIMYIFWVYAYGCKLNIFYWFGFTIFINYIFCIIYQLSFDLFAPQDTEQKINVKMFSFVFHSPSGKKRLPSQNCPRVADLGRLKTTKVGYFRTILTSVATAFPKGLNDQLTESKIVFLEQERFRGGKPQRKCE